jgi:ell wall binding domain 2 (CWB2)
VLSSVRYFLADVGHWIWSHKLFCGVVVLALALAGGAVYVIATDEDAPSGPAPAPQVVVAEVPAPADARDLGFPEFATNNTTRVAGSDPVANAAGVALAVYPSTGDSPSPDAVTLVDAGSWQVAVAASVLMAEPVGAPLLVTEAGGLPSLTESALGELDPQGSPATKDTQVFVTPAAAEPDDFETLAIEGGDPAEAAGEIAKLRERLAGEPDHIVVTSSEAASYAMPAAGWAARSGDPILFVGREGVPQATIEALRRNDGVPVYVLGPESAVSGQTMRQLARIAPSAQRVGAEGPVENAVAFARFADGSFGWNINDPGHGFVIANTERPMDAAIASPLSASGTWGPLLLTDDAAALPSSLRSYLLDLKPGYENDPTRALYNHVWLIGDSSALSVDLQAEADELAEVAPITSGAGADAAEPGEPESQPDEPQGNQDDDR